MWEPSRGSLEAPIVVHAQWGRCQLCPVSPNAKFRPLMFARWAPSALRASASSAQPAGTPMSPMPRCACRAPQGFSRLPGRRGVAQAVPWDTTRERPDAPTAPRVGPELSRTGRRRRSAKDASVEPTKAPSEVRGVVLARKAGRRGSREVRHQTTACSRMQSIRTSTSVEALE